MIEQTRKHIHGLVEEIAALSKQELAPADYFNEYLQRVQRALACTAGAVWMFTPQGHLQLQFQINMRQIGMDASDSHRERHAELLRLIVTKGQPLIMAPHSGVEDNGNAGGAQRHGRKTVVEAISGADVVEKRSNLVQLQRQLFDRVIEWKEKLIYAGTRDDTLPPDVLKALDGYLAESNSKLLVVMPLRDEREKENEKPARSALMMECFEPNQAPEQLVSRLEVVGKHAAPAL